MNESKFADICKILGDFWVDYRLDEEFEEFIEFHDIGLPLAYAIANELVSSTPKAEGIIHETWISLLDKLEIEQDTGFTTFDDLLGLDS